MAFGVRLMVTWPLGQANYNRELPLAAWGLGVFDPLSSPQKGQYWAVCRGARSQASGVGEKTFS